MAAIDFVEDALGYDAQPKKAEKSFSFAQNKPVKEVDFPIDAFPNAIQVLIETFQKNLMIEPEFSATGVLSVASVAIGNSYHVAYKEGAKLQNCSIFCCSVGRSGSNKSYPLAILNNPIINRDIEIIEQFKEDKKEWVKNGCTGPEPRKKKTIYGNVTIEALIQGLSHNRRGVGIFNDEIISWVSNLNRYSKGDDSDEYLQLWSGTTVNTSRKNEDFPVIVKHPFASIWGTTQPSRLEEFAKGSRANSGFLDRFLFFIPKNKKAPETLPEKGIDKYALQIWDDVIRNITDTVPLIEDERGNPEPTTMVLDNEAFQIFSDFYTEFAKEMNSGDDTTASYLSKLQLYSCRIALILHFLHMGCGEKQGEKISAKVMRNAIKLIRYFRYTSEVVRKAIRNTSPLDKMGDDFLKFYDKLEDEFSTSEAIEIGAKLGVSKNTPSNWIKTGIANGIFCKKTHGKYAKKY